MCKSLFYAFSHCRAFFPGHSVKMLAISLLTACLMLCFLSFGSTYAAAGEKVGGVHLPGDRLGNPFVSPGKSESLSTHNKIPALGVGQPPGSLPPGSPNPGYFPPGWDPKVDRYPSNPATNERLRMKGLSPAGAQPRSAPAGPLVRDSPLVKDSPFARPTH